MKVDFNDDSNYENQDTQSIKVPPIDNDEEQSYSFNQSHGRNTYNPNNYTPNNYTPSGYYYKKKSGNTGLVVAVSILGVLLVAVAAFAILWFTGIIGHPNTNSTAAEQSAPVEAPADTGTQQPVTMYVANVKNSIYFRRAPVEESSNIICEIPLGTAVSFIENTNAVFAKISYNGSEGYVKREYLSSSVPSKNSAPAASSGDTKVKYDMYVSNVKNSIYFRTSPAEDSTNIICEIPLGACVGFIEKANNVFSKIYYNGNYGYVKSEYLSTSCDLSPTHYMTVCNVKTSIYLRSTPQETSDNIICEIPVNSTVEFIEMYNDTFYQISWNGYTGYAKAEYLR